MITTKEDVSLKSLVQVLISMMRIGFPVRVGRTRRHHY
jgi:hypothetical protein